MGELNHYYQTGNIVLRVMPAPTDVGFVCRYRDLTEGPRVFWKLVYGADAVYETEHAADKYLAKYAHQRGAVKIKGDVEEAVPIKEDQPYEKNSKPKRKSKKVKESEAPEEKESES